MGRLSRRVARHKLSTRSLGELTPQPRKIRAQWATRAALGVPEWQTLLVPPYSIHQLLSVDTQFANDPTLEQLQQPDAAEALQMDQFTHAVWLRHFTSTQQYGVKSVMPDSFYVNMVKELYHRGHIDRSTLVEECPALRDALRQKLKRGARFMLFEPPSSLPQPTPVLVLVKDSALSLSSPTYEQCVRAIPISQVRALLTQLHAQLGHAVMGIADLVGENYVGIPREVCDLFCRHCLHCQEAAFRSHRQQPSKSIRQRHPRYRYVADLTFMGGTRVRAHDGLYYSCILVMVDHFSRYRWAKALQNQTAASVIMALQQWWTQNGRPIVFQSDNGLQFAAAEVRELCRLWGVRKRHSRPRHPQTNGLVENANRDLKRRIISLQRDRPEDTWVELLDVAVSIYNGVKTRVHHDAPRMVLASEPLAMAATLPLATTAVPAAVIDDWESDSDNGNDDEPLELSLAELGEPSAGSEGDGLAHDELMEGDDAELHQRDEPAFGAGGQRKLALVRQKDKAECHAEERMGNSTLHEAADGVVIGMESETASPKPQQHSDVASEASSEQEAQLERDGLEVVSCAQPPQPEYGPPPDTTEDVLYVDPAQCQVPAAMRFSQWSRISVALYRDMRRSFVPGLGDCGVIAPYAAHRQLHLLRKDAKNFISDDTIREERAAATEWLSLTTNASRYDMQPMMATTISELRATLANMGTWVQPELLWVYAARHRLNVYVCTLQAHHMVLEGTKNSTFDFRLITPQSARGASRPIRADAANTIAIYFHTVSHCYGSKVTPSEARRRRETEGLTNTGHFEYLVHAATRTSCWRVDDPAVRDILQPALEYAERIRHLNHYSEAMDRQANAARARGLPAVAVDEVVMWMPSDYFRSKSDYNLGRDGQVYSMPVRIVQQLPTQAHGNGRSVARFVVLSHSGVVKESVDHGELRAVGQDVDAHGALRQREVTEDMLTPGQRVPLMTAWNEYLQRYRRRASEGSQQWETAARATARTRQKEAAAHNVDNTPASIGQPDTKPPVDASAPPADVLSPRMTRSQRQTAVAVSAGAEAVKCCVCLQNVLPVGSQIKCGGTCQQSMHGTASACAAKYVHVGAALFCCSSNCASLFAR